MIVSDGERDKTMVQELLELKTKVDDIVLNSFQESLCFYDTVRESFETVVNKRRNKPAELIGKREMCCLLILKCLPLSRYLLLNHGLSDLIGLIMND